MLAALIELLPGDGILGTTLLSLSFERLIFFGLEKSFILELFVFGSLSGGGPENWVNCDGGKLGEGRGVLPLGKAALAALVAASLFPPRVPLEYGRPPANATCGL